MIDSTAFWAGLICIIVGFTVGVMWFSTTIEYYDDEDESEPPPERTFHFDEYDRIYAHIDQICDAMCMVESKDDHDDMGWERDDDCYRECRASDDF